MADTKHYAREILDGIVAEDPAKVKDSFQKGISLKIDERLETMKTVIAKDYLNNVAH